MVSTIYRNANILIADNLTYFIVSHDCCSFTCTFNHLGSSQNPLRILLQITDCVASACQFFPLSNQCHILGYTGSNRNISITINVNTFGLVFNRPSLKYISHAIWECYQIIPVTPCVLMRIIVSIISIICHVLVHTEYFRISVIAKI